MFKFLPSRTVRGRLLTVAVMVEAIMLSLLLANSLRLLQNNMGEQAASHAGQIGPFLASAIGAPLSRGDLYSVRAIVTESRNVKGLEYLVVLDQNNEIIAASGWELGKALPAPDPSYRSLPTDAHHYNVAYSVSYQSQQVGTLRFALNLSQIVTARSQLLTQSVLIAFGELMLSVGLLAMIGMWLTRHLTELAEASNSVAAGNFTPGRVSEGDDDVGRLGRAFNAMSAAVAARMTELTEARDTERMLAAAVETEHARIVSLLRAMDIGVLFVDMQDRVVYENPAFRLMWGIEENRVLLSEVAEDVFAAARVCPLEPVAFRKSHSQRLDQLEVATNNGRVFTQRLSRVQDSHSKQLGYVWLFEDVTDERQAATQLRQAKDAAEQAAKAKAAFLATMSHEIRTPMNGIIGMSDLLMGTQVNAEQKEYLKWVKSSADSLLVIVNDILDFSKIDSGNVSLEKIPFGLADLMSELIGRHSTTAKTKGIALSWDAEATLPAAVMGDPVRLKQVLDNLVSNAIKFTSSGEVKVTLSSGKPSAGSEEIVRFVVKDNGIGIPPERIQSIFDPFTQADSSTTRKFGGTGLGLTIASRLVQLMGGALSVESVEGHGSTFSFLAHFERHTLPDKALAEVVAASASAPVAKLGGRILLVEDTPVNQRLAQAMLTKAGFAVTLAGDGHEALAAFENACFDLILMDVQMPNMDGLEATQHIRQKELVTASGHVPIIALTANVMPEDRKRCADAGMDDFIAKPFRAPDVLAVIQRWISPKTGEQ